jgi:hypothetical protein
MTAVVVTTLHKGVFFGYIDGAIEQEARTVRIQNARMCIYWTADVQGVFGLASKGPNGGCRIGPKVPAIVLQDVTAIAEASDEAAKRWEEGLWSR